MSLDCHFQVSVLCIFSDYVYSLLYTNHSRREFASYFLQCGEKHGIVPAFSFIYCIYMKYFTFCC